ncbi:uncharacterized protein LOC133538720 isoform X1 [Nerophis ophidion]|uniref:uncharacterized protein LOC133538720 isoform X1 n=1 Tax=Nerophis ophidion TaxID=159077 RepID=UPI002AE08846|nr:uncharacterized protein LOC133538720 isoform X1 [Nerophis ophidion]
MESHSKIWTAEETHYLLYIWTSAEVQSELETATRTRPVLERIREEMAEAGFVRTFDQINNKLKKLKKDYRDHKKGLCRQRSAGGKMLFFKQLNSVLGTRKTCQLAGKAFNNYKTSQDPGPSQTCMDFLSEADELALRENIGEHAMNGTPGGTSSESLSPQDTHTFIKYSDSALCLVEPKEEDDKDTVFTALGRDPERPAERTAGHEQCSSNSSSQIEIMPVNEVYKMHLLKKMEKTDKEMVYLDWQIKKAHLEFEILKYKLEFRKFLSKHSKTSLWSY